MRVSGKLAVGIAVATGFFAYQFIMHSVVTAGQITPLKAALVLSPFAIAAGWAIKVDKGWVVGMMVAAILTLATFAAVSHLGFEHSAFTFGLPHMAGNLFMMWLFARTLGGEREPLITTIARKVHGTLKPEIERYTRTVTIAWTLFFAMQVAASLILFTFAPLEIWSTYVNLLNVPLIILMFIIEYIYRVLRYREHKSSIFSAVHFFNRDAGESKTHKVQ
ncbi:MAG TPA: hypothetical protein VGD24_08485 [Gallionella sp.]